MSVDSQWHSSRRKKILAKYPEIKQYFGNYSFSIVALQWTIAWLVKDLSWWQTGAIAFFVGQFILHSLAIFVHEAAHNLIFKSKLGSNQALLLNV